MPTRGSIPGRLGSFILGHILCSVLYFFFSFLNFRQADPVSSTIAVVQIYLLPAALYLLAGCLFSLLRHWPRPDRKTASHSVLFPTLCAWGWVAASAGVGIFGSLAGIPALEGAGSWMFFSTVYWAPASALFVFLSLLYSLGGLPWPWLVCVPLAGLLPPLLFFLGSLLPHRFRRPQLPALPEGGTPA